MNITQNTSRLAAFDKNWNSSPKTAGTDPSQSPSPFGASSSEEAVVAPQDGYRPGFVPREHRSYARAVRRGLTAAAVTAVPGSIGAGLGSTIGAGAGTGVNAFFGPATGAAMGVASTFHNTTNIARENPLKALTTFLFDAPVAALAGALAFPVLSTVGTLGGLPGMAVASAIAGVGFGAAEAVSIRKHNQEVDQYNRQGRKA